ncbi:ABC transporter ATP-binding protein [Chloroflexota bacterium]
MLQIEGLNVTYGKTKALKGISLSVSPGEIVALIGPNGAGKSTLIRTVSGVVSKKSGEIKYARKDLDKMTPAQRARILAVVPQARQMGGAFTVQQTVMMGRTAYMNWLGQPDVEDHQYVKQALESTCTYHIADRRIAELSGGEQQRVLLARALAQNTPLLILDEPTNHLDLQHQATILSLVQQQVVERGIAVLMAMHDLNTVSLYANRVALMVAGELVKIGKPDEVLDAETIYQAYRTSVQVIRHPDVKVPIIFPNH